MKSLVYDINQPYDEQFGYITISSVVDLFETEILTKGS